MPHEGMTTRSRTRAEAAAMISNTSQPRSQVTVCENSSIYSIPSSVSAPTPEKTLRGYQSRIAGVCEEQNTLVVIPTGAGKTVIAAEVIKRSPPNALFIVPTRPLVEQQAKALRSWSSRVVFELKSGAKLPHNKPFDVLVATPGAFMPAQESDARLDWSTFKIVVFDEVHHESKKKPCRALALSLREWSLQQPLPSRPRVLGLTASYSYEMGETGAKVALARICNELLITKTETASHEELKASGYHATVAAAEVLSPPATIIPRGVLPKAERIHEQAATFLQREATGESTDFSLRLMACVRSMEDEIKNGDCPDFVSPLVLTGDVKVGMWGTYAHNLARQNAGGIRRRTANSEASRRGRGNASSRGRRSHQRQPEPSSHRPQLAELEHWYEAIKTLVVSWEEREDHAATILDIFGCTGSPAFHQSTLKQQQQRKMDVWPGWVVQKIRAFWEQVPKAFPRFEHLKKALLDKYEHHGGSGNPSGVGRPSAASNGGGKAFRGIVFVRERVTTHVLAHVIASDPSLAFCFSAACVYASSSPATASLALSEQEVRANIEAFRSGRVNLLLATVVAEEGLDVPAANCVVRYDRIEHTVSFVQGRGRAREEGSSFVVLDERSDRTTADLEAVERRSNQYLEGFEPRPFSGTAEEVTGRAQQIDPDDTAFTDAGSTDTRVDAGSAGANATSDDVSLACSSVPTEADDAASLSADRTGTCFESDENIPEVVEPLSAGVRNVSQSLSSAATDDFVDRDTGSMGAAAASKDIRLSICQAIERRARAILIEVQAKHGTGVGMSPNGTPVPPQGMLSALEKFASVADADLEEEFKQNPVSRLWVCTLSFKPALRELHAPGEAVRGKKMARKLAATRLVADLISITAPTEADDTASSGAERTDTRIEPDENIPERNARSIGTTSASEDTSLTTWQALERGARGILVDVETKHGLGVCISSGGTPMPPAGVLSAVTLFAGKTNAVLEEEFEQEPFSGLWVCTLSYKSALRELHASGEAVRGKRIARKLAATRLVAGLLDELPA
ncbi:unnamed protein product [Pylaiella littoralis]